MFGEDRNSPEGDARWRAHCTEKLLQKFRGLLTVAYVDSRSTDPKGGWGVPTQYSVLIAGVPQRMESTTENLDASPGHMERYRWDCM